LYNFTLVLVQARAYNLDMKIIRRVILALLTVLLLAILGFIAWGSTPAAPMPEALAAIQSDDRVTVKTAGWLEFKPAGQDPVTGFIFYPGGRVDYRAYAPAARAIAAKGYLVIIPAMPLNLAFFAPEKAAEVIAAYPSIRNWAVGGHSLGGSMAARFARNHPDKVDGLILSGSFPASSDDLSQSSLKVVSIYGSLDGLAIASEIDASRALLPAATTWVKIEGGDHAQFGWYGAQPGDNPATISREAQQEATIRASTDLLTSLGN
jgi:dienelactone hydrolase